MLKGRGKKVHFEERDMGRRQVYGRVRTEHSD
jgi:hypothetical protein